MPLTQSQIDTLLLILDGDKNADPPVLGLNDYVNTILEGREDVRALIRIHTDIPNANCSTIITNAKTRARTAAQNIVTLLT